MNKKIELTIEKFGSIFLLFLALGMFIVFFMIKDLNGDDGDVYWRFNLLKVHLANDFAMPYFTPARCGGFHLAADAHDLIFSLYMLISFLIPNTVWAIKISNLLLSIILATGVYLWLKYFNIQNQMVRIFVGIIAVVSGYWVINLTQGGHVWAHGFAYTPWIMYYIEMLFEQKPGWKKDYLVKAFTLIILFFLLINSGYYWLQVAVPMIGLRFIAEFLITKESRWEQLKRLGIILFLGFFAILLSFPRLGGIFEFQLLKFPRLGGSIDHFPLIEDTRKLLEAYWKSFFDASAIGGRRNKFLGVWWDYSDFIGLTALIPLGLGFFRFKELFRSKAFVGLLLASLFQFGMTRSHYVADALRTILPLYKQITWYWRGTGIVTFFFCVLMASGYQFVLQWRNKFLVFLVLGLMTLNLAEILNVQLKQLDFSPNPPFKDVLDTSNNPKFPKPLVYNNFCCNLSNIYGYLNPYPSQISIGASINGGQSIDLSPQEGYYNMHDARRIASSEANHGYFLDHAWPLWPRTDQAEFEKFINYKQIIKLPLYIRIMNKVSMGLWIIYVVAFLWLIWPFDRNKGRIR